MTVLHTGATKNYAAGWEAIFAVRTGGRTKTARPAKGTAKRGAARTIIRKPKAARTAKKRRSAK